MIAGVLGFLGGSCLEVCGLGPKTSSEIYDSQLDRVKGHPVSGCIGFCRNTLHIALAASRDNSELTRGPIIMLPMVAPGTAEIRRSISFQQDFSPQQCAFKRAKPKHVYFTFREESSCQNRKTHITAEQSVVHFLETEEFLIAAPREKGVRVASLSFLANRQLLRIHRKKPRL